MSVPRATTLVVTNDFPPRLGGIESFVRVLCDLLDHDVVVLTRAEEGGDAYDADLPFPVVRLTGTVLPTARVAREAERLIAAHGCTRLVFGAAAPLGLLAPRLRRAGIERILAITHGHEIWWSSVPGFRALMRRIGRAVDHVSYISDFTAGLIRPALGAAARQRMVRLSPPVDTARFVPAPTRPERPTVVAAGRMIKQKGFDTLLEAWAEVDRRWPDGDTRPELLLVGGGPEKAALRAQSKRLGVTDTVTFVGSVAHAEMPHVLQRGHVFALPVRTRRAGLNPEGLGLVFLEAASCGLAVVAGNSGGASETLVPRESGLLVESEDAEALAGHLVGLLTNLDRAERMGRVGRQHVKEHFSANRARETLRRVLGLD